MIKRAYPTVVFATLLATLPLSAFPADLEATPEQQARLDRAEALKAEADSREQAAQKLLDEKKVVCARKFFVNDCLEAAEKAYRAESRAAQRLDNEAKAIERAVKREQRLARDQEYAEGAPQREEDRAERAAKVQESREAAEAKRSRILLRKAEKAEKGAQRKAAEEEKQRRKQAEHAAKQAEKAAKAKAKQDAANANAP